MVRMKSKLLAIALLCLGAASARADTGLENLPIGSIVKGTAQLGNKQFPLPAGDWQLVARGKRMSTNSAMGVPSIDVYLAQIENRILRNVIYVRTNLASSGHGWVRDTGVCDRGDVHHAVSDRSYNQRDAECWTVNHIGFFMDTNPTEAQRDFFRFVNDIRRPVTALSITYFLNNAFDYLRVSYLTNPELAGFEPTPTSAWTGNPWHRDMISGNAKRVAYVQQMKAEGEKLLPLIKTGMRGALPPGTVVSVGGQPPSAQVNAPSPASSSDKTADPAERMLQLKRLFDEKLITEAEYQERRRKILEGM